MDGCFGYDHASEPAVQEIEGVVADMQNPDQRVVAKSEDDGWDEVEDGKSASAAAQRSKNSWRSGDVPRKNQAVCNIAEEVDHEEQGVEAGGKRAYIDGFGELEFAVVTGTEEGSV